MKILHQKEQAHFKTKIEEIQMKLTSPIAKNKKLNGNKQEREGESFMWWIDDAVMNLKRLISEAVMGWNARFQEAVIVAKKKDDKEKEKVKKPSEGSSKLSNQNSSTIEENEVIIFLHLPNSSVTLIQYAIKTFFFQAEEKDEDLISDVTFDSTIPSIRQLSDSITDSVDAESDDNMSALLSGSEVCDHEKGMDDVKEKKSLNETMISCDECQSDSKQDKKSVKTILSQILTSNKDYVPMQVLIVEYSNAVLIFLFF